MTLQHLQKEVQTLPHWKGSAKTANMVREEIGRRFGEEEAANYQPLVNCFTLATWNELGYKVKKDEQAIRSLTYVPDKQQAKGKAVATDGEAEQEVRTYRKTVSLFYWLQVEKR